MLEPADHRTSVVLCIRRDPNPERPATRVNLPSSTQGHHHLITPLIPILQHWPTRKRRGDGYDTSCRGTLAHGGKSVRATTRQYIARSWARVAESGSKSTRKHLLRSRVESEAKGDSG
ncbi:hypothetical protein R1flu_005603 [Riccia fluitans]|uniref:Uncharacterized protein n=1 Tax=Riccia fluitans TaxID=41844 RepID=A0ABD1YUK0_9MARC